MTAATIRNKLHSYLEVADTKKLKALYTIIEAEIEEALSGNLITDLQMEEIERRRANYLSGKSKVHVWKDAKDLIG